MVDDILASCYAEVDHYLAHVTMTTMQWFPEILDWVFGVDAGFSLFVDMIQNISLLLFPHGEWFEFRESATYLG